ncbi:hypothetical protein M0R45_034910 [Rubus argutus]|uniref:Reverse transcriptase Ty1/copia-type domain-containing protein n=1 Tax=Rubus argutus TaxID=59490 RepID=A0AAW1VRL5_RUBAR
MQRPRRTCRPRWMMYDLAANQSCTCPEARWTLGSKDYYPQKRVNLARTSLDIAISIDPSHEIIRIMATEIITNDDIEPYSVDEYQRRDDWPKWKEIIQVELDSLTKRNVFGSVVPTPPHVKPEEFNWVFIRKRNEKNEIVRYKARLVAQDISQRPEIDYEELYSPVMDVITFHYLISLVVFRKIEYAVYECGYSLSLWGS